MIYSREVEEMCPVAQGVHHGAAPIPEEAKWVQAKEVKDISGLTHGVGWCAPQQGACKLTLNVKEGIIQEALVETIGCSGMTHSAAMASEILPGLTVMEALNTDLVCDAINTAMRQTTFSCFYLLNSVKQPELDGKIAKLQGKIERNLEYRKRVYEQFMDEVLSKEEYLELKQMYETENQKYQKELSELNHEEQRQRAAVNETKIWLEHFNRRRITVKQLTREALVELVDKIYVYPEQKIDIYFKFASVESSPDRILEKDGVI